MLYLEGVKYPLEELYYELYSYFSKIDSDLLTNKRRSISSAYNDARFCSDNPIKEYFYIRFKKDTANKKNALGFFFDASLDGYKFGLNIYNLDARGMEKIRDYILDNKHYSKEIIENSIKRDYWKYEEKNIKERIIRMRAQRCRSGWNAREYRLYMKMN